MVESQRYLAPKLLVSRNTAQTPAHARTREYLAHAQVRENVDHQLLGKLQ